jgi:hypothetical protein
VTSVNGAAPVAAPIPSGKANINHLEVSMLTKTIIIEVSAESEEALNTKIQTVLSDPAVKEAKPNFWVNPGAVEYLEDVVATGYAQNHLSMVPVYRTKQRSNSLPVYAGKFGLILKKGPRAPKLVTPPESFVELAVDGTFSRWLSSIADNSTNPKERRVLVQNVRSLVEQCAFEQRSDSIDVLEEQFKNGEWYSVHGDLPAPYEDVRILVDGRVRIARLGHDRNHFQFAHYMGNAKSQYGVMLEHVQGWQPLVAIPAKKEDMAEA